MVLFSAEESLMPACSNKDVSFEELQYQLTAALQGVRDVCNNDGSDESGIGDPFFEQKWI